MPSSKKTASAPSATKTAPTMPPISAWDELDGSPKYQVIRFHAIAPTSPLNTASRPIEVGWISTTSWATVAATSSEMNAPTKFRIAAYPTAIRGGIARVEIDVATTFAVSWKPFVKSKMSAVATTITTMISLPMLGCRLLALGVLDDDAFEDVRHMLRGVDRLLQALEDVLPTDHNHGVDPIVEQGCDGFADDAVPVVLEAVDLNGVVSDDLEPAQPGHRLCDLAPRGVQNPSEVLGLRHRRLDLVEPEVVGNLLGVVHDVVERGRQRVDVLTVNRRDEHLIEPLDDVVRDPVAVLLADQDLPRELVALGVLLEQFLEQPGRAQDVPAGLLKQVEELSVA